MSKYRVLQLTNAAVGAVDTNGFMPFGIITRRISCGANCGTESTFTVSTTGANIIYLNEAGYYKITYSATLAAGAAGAVTSALIANGVSVSSASETTAAVGNNVNLTIVFMVRVLPNCDSVPNNAPISIQVQNTGVAVTGGNSNLLIERVY